MVAKAIHAMLRVMDEVRSVAFYKDAFNLDIANRLDFDGFTLVYLRNSESEFELELTINKGNETPYELGNGYGHIAFVVDDLDAEHTRFVNAGYEPRKLIDFKHEGVLLARFFFVTDPDGYEIEVMQRHGRYQ
jgi:lactoylglutathione lyase